MISDTPKVSICAPAYNNASEVERLLKSIYAQKYTDFEVNISDDSTDDAIERLVALYRDEHENINYIHNQKPYGHIFNWNAAIKMARGAYIKIMFSDDWFTDEESLGAYVALLDKSPDAMLAFAGSRQVSLDDGMKFYDRHATPQFIGRLRRDYRLLFRGNEIGAPSAVIYRRGESLTLFDEKSNWASDMYLYFDLLVKSPKIVYTTKPLVSIGVHEHQYTESFSQKDIRIYNDYRYMYEKYNLRESKACREYFTKQFLVKYNKGIREAHALGIELSMYLKAYICEFFDSVRCFLRARFGKSSKELK
ncbi:MAG: glycosyltransferase family 2 protein [Lachnospiraceae bacterium]|nr:glycosyltransferase family 2 protein [Lachnospiraceae bacterium]